MNIKISLRRTRAVFKKQVKDVLKNKMILLQFILFPLMAVILTALIGETDGIPKGYFALMFAPMYAGMVPMITMAAVIGEEKEKKSLKVLAISGVKPFEYLAGTGGFVVLISLLASLVFGLSASLSAVQMLIFIAVMLLGTLASLLLGCAAGLLSKNQMNATAIAMPAAMILAFVPMIAIFNESFKKAADILFTQQISNILNNLPSSGYTFMNFLIIGINAILFLGAFFLSYKKGGFAE